jgi:hypothetical protein
MRQVFIFEEDERFAKIGGESRNGIADGLGSLVFFQAGPGIRIRARKDFRDGVWSADRRID